MTVDAIGPTLAEPGHADAAPGATAGAQLGKYRLDRVIGAGGMGMVWQGYDPDLERAVAIKVLRDAGEAALRTRLLREARAMARLKHPNVLVVYEVGTDANRDYIAMELVDGGDLTAWLPSKPPRAEVLEAMVAAGRGLAAAHDAGLVHRDFKPHNILRGRDGRVYVTDFGLARGQLDPAGELDYGPPAAVAPGDSGAGPTPARPLDSVLDSELTQTGVLIGTPAYMAPEQFAGRAPDPRTDQFAFCVTAWEALAGARPFRGDTLDALRVAVGQGAPTGAVEIPSRLRAILARGLQPEPAARWADMRALLTALEAASAPRRPWLRTAIALSIGLIGAGALIATRPDHGAAPAAPACAPAAEVFAPAWSGTKRAHLAKTPGGQGIAAIAILDEVQRDWTQAYEAACARPPTAKTQTELACLVGARDEVASATEDFDEEVDGDDVHVTALALLSETVRQCGRE